jgi:hypothetical protein
MVFLTNPTFGEGIGLSIHIRTKGRYEYSFIESAAIKIGNDVLEVGSWGQYFLNDVESADLPAQLGEIYTVSHEQMNQNETRFNIQITETEQIVVSTFKDWVSVKTVNSTFANFVRSAGLLGSYVDGSKLARNGTVMIGDINAFGQEWQVLESEMKLFQNPNRFPRHPRKCLMPKESKAFGRRPLGEAIGAESAEKACSHLENKTEKKMCISDVMAAGDLGYAQARAF